MDQIAENRFCIFQQDDTPAQGLKRT
jgi:hypothetical protein